MPKTIRKALKVLFLVQIVVSVAGTGLFTFIYDPQLGASYAIGATLMTANLALLAWSSWRLIAKKSIAWTVMIIVIKYAVLLGSVVYFARASWFSSFGAGLGVASFVLAALVSATLLRKENIEIGSSTL
jgi:hypothetical protein